MSEHMYPGETFTFTLDGIEFEAEVVYDEHHGAPWVEEDGHGEVSDWTSRDKRPGELILNEDGRSKRFYDFQGACKIARQDGWDAKPYNTGQETKRQQAAKAARADYEWLRGWCNDEWCYVGVVVRRADDCRCCGETSDLWGIDSASGDYIRQVAADCAGDLIARKENAA